VCPPCYSHTNDDSNSDVGITPPTNANSENAKDLDITNNEISASLHPWTLDQKCKFIELKEALDYIVLSWILWKVAFSSVYQHSHHVRTTSKLLCDPQSNADVRAGRHAAE
jgi:hypothetical protein